MAKFLLFRRRRWVGLLRRCIGSFRLFEDGDDVVVYLNVGESVIVFIFVVHGRRQTIAVVVVRTKERNRRERV